METDIMENSAYSNGAEVSSLCLNTGMPLDGNHYDAGINCQMVAMNHDGQIMSPESMMAELSINAENGGGVIVGNNGDIDVHLLPPEERPVTPSPSNVQGLPPRELHAALRRQLEYYFSRENLAKDTYLLSQMDKDQYVSIEIVAQFNNIRGLTLDQNLVLEVLRSSSEVHVDESGLKVRPNSRRCVILLRDVPREVDQEQIKQMFEMEKCPVQLAKCESTGTDGFWYLYFSSDEDATSAIRYLKETLVNYPNTNIPIMARIKAGKQPASGGGQYRNNNAPPTSNVIRPLGIVTAPSPVGSTISNQSAAVSPVSSLSGSVHNPAVLMPNVTPPSSVMGNEPGTVGVAPYSAANVFSAYPTNVPMLANNSRVYTTAPFYAPSPMIQLPSSTAPCYDLSTVFVANGLAPHTYSSGVVTSLTAGVPQACLSVAPAGSAHQQQPSLQFIATSGSGGPALIATNPGNSSSSGGGRYGGSNSNYGNNYSHYSHHYNTYPKSHGGGGGHHRTMNNVSANSNSGGPPGKPYRNNKYANSGGGGYMSGQYHPQQQQHHPSHSVYHPAYPPSSAAYHPNSYVPNAVAPNAVHPAAAVILTESPVSGAGLVNNSNPSSISSSVVCPPPSATASSASTSTSASCSSTSAISICVTTASNKESSVTGQPLKPTLHFNKQQQQSSGVNHATSHVLNSSVALPQAQHSGTTSQPHYSTKSSHHHVNSHSQNIHHKSNVEPMSEAPVASKPAILASKTTNAATVVHSSNGHPMDADRSSHSNNYSHRSSNQSSSLRNGPRTFEREPREYREPRELRLPKTGGAAGGAAGSGSGSGGYRGKREYSNNYIPPSSLTGAGAAPVSEIDGNVIRKSERSGSGKFSRGGGGPSGANPSKPDRDRTGSGTFSRPGRNGPQSSGSNAIAPPEQPFKLQDTAFPPLPGMTEGGGGSGDSKEAVESTAAIIHSSDAQSGSNMGANGAGGPGKSHESSLADVVKGHASVASLSLNGNTSSPVLEDRNANNNSENSSHQQTTPVESKPHQQQQQRKSNIKESKTVEEEEKLCNALNKSSGSRCDHGADDGLSVLPVPVKEEQLKIGNSSRGNQIKAAAAPLPDDAHASPDASHTTESDDLLRTNSLDSGVATKEDKHQQQAISKFDMDLTENSSYSSGADASSLSRSSDFPLDGLPGAPAFDVSSQSSTFTYAQIARLKANKLASQAAAAAAASAVATANHDSGTASLASSPSDHTIAANNVGVGASLVNHHIHKDQHSATSNASLRTRSIVK